MANNFFLLSNIDFKSETSASYKRVKSYALALSTEGTNVFLSSRYNYLNLNDPTNITKIEKVSFIGIPESRKKNKFINIYLENFFFISYYQYIKQIHLLSKLIRGNNIFMVYPGNFALFLISLLFLKYIKGEKVFVEKNELMVGIALNYPLQYHPFRLVISLLIKSLLLITGFIQDALTPCFSGMLLISTNLEKLYSKSNSHMIRIPILCSNYNYSHIKENYDIFLIGYTGDINQNKDGLKSFINTLGALEKKDFIFHIWGSGGLGTQRSIRKHVKKNGLTDKVFFHEPLRHDQLKSAISKMDLLVLPRPLNVQTKYGFSTKLGEYLMSGIAVLVTDVSDNKLYIKNNHNGFIVKSGSKMDMLKKLDEIINLDKSLLINVGKEGRKTACLHFDPLKYSRILNSFLFN